jgi:hypothetical protein
MLMPKKDSVQTQGRKEMVFELYKGNLFARNNNWLLVGIGKAKNVD